ncbi:uncharacterized protein F5147DRAFT_779216 [Suillus discolor]|uniref:Uncharacterized protein n=1 Tax=Suillus discolor TaxID=1912936 RepID=A0A9P7JNS6_9AGAM|nr:uncharacterized protein F5147DRAFT_779216 [Suillus discolor]KAG2093702.1 hypothetical protein F5147DRAFT_779216 [Suillus discolor]
MSNRRMPADVDQTHSAIPSSASEQLQDNQPRTQAHSLSSSSASFHQSTSAPATATGDQQWFPQSQQMIVTSSSFYDPTQASASTPQWRILSPTTHNIPAAIKFNSSSIHKHAPSYPLHGARHVVAPGLLGTIGKGVHKASNTRKSLLPFLSILLQPNLLLSRLNSQQANPTLHSAEHQYPAQQPQPHFSPPPQPTQSQFQIQQTQFPPTPQFSQSQAQPRPHSQSRNPIILMFQRNRMHPLTLKRNPTYTLMSLHTPNLNLRSTPLRISLNTIQDR